MSNRPATGVAVPTRPEGGLAVVAAAGGLLALLGAWQSVAGGVAGSAVEIGSELFVSVGLPLTAVGIVGYTCLTTRLPTDPIVRWTLAGIVGLGLLAVWSSVPEFRAGRLADAADSLLVGANLGIVFGAVAGINRAHAADKADLVERERAHREGLAVLNHLLRHHVLNGMTIISGHADELRATDVPAEHLEAIERQSERIVTVVDNVQTLVRSLSEETEPKPVEVDVVAERAVADARETDPEATFDLDADPAVARADEFLRAVLDNLVSNAVEHHDGDPHVRVVVEDGDRVVVRVADDGPGVPDPVRGSFAETEATSTAVAGDGLGLYLVHTLVTNYGGSVRIEDNDPRGTVVVVELPRY